MRNIVPALHDDIVTCAWIDGPKIRLGSGIEIGPNLTAPHLWVIGKVVAQMVEGEATAYFLDSYKLRLRFNKKQHPHALATIEAITKNGGEPSVCCVGEILPNATKPADGESRVVQLGVVNTWTSSDAELKDLLDKRAKLIDGESKK